jgi:hypothetical protein
VLPVLALFVSCADGTEPVAAPFDHAAAHAVTPHMGVGHIDDALAREVRQATARFSSTTQATKAGYVVGSPCVEAPGLGGMGFHWVANALVDPVFDALQPEAVLYEPQKNGRLELVAVEYIVVDVGQPAPTFGGQPFDVGGTPLPVPHWSLHLWVHRENPGGVFMPFNPNVDCP